MARRLSAPSRACAIAASLALSSVAAAFQPLITDDTGTQGAGGNQIEFSYNEDQVEQGGAHTRGRALPLVYTRGLTDTLDVFAQANEGGTGNPSFGLKWRFFENEESKTSLGVKPEIRYPLNPRGEPSRAQERTTHGVTAILTQEVEFGAIHANLYSGQDTFRDSAGFPRVTTLRLSVAPVWDVTDRLKLALDIGTEHARSAGTTTVSNIAELGVIWSPNKELDLAAGIVRSIDDSNPKTTTVTGTVGVTWRFK